MTFLLRYPTLYLAGPMSDHDKFNYPLFNHNAEELRKAGYKVLNPAENPRDIHDPWQAFMRDAITELMKADAVATLYGWQYSRGAKIEVELARSLGIPARTAETWLVDSSVAKLKR